MRVTRVVREENVMSDWLNEIEEKLNDGMSRSSENEKRMARVIRELVMRLNEAYDELDELCHDRHYYIPLSPDAKELLEQ